MPIYRLTFIYELRNQGWTETYYRFAGSARRASDLGGFNTLQHWLLFRPQACKLQAIRAQEVDGLRRVYLRELGYQGVHDRPDVTSTAAVLQLDFSGTAGRHLWLRGLPDEWVKRTTSGRDDPHPRFLREVRTLSETIRQLNLMGRQIVHTHRWSHAFEFGPGPKPQLTRVVVRENFLPKFGQYVYFGVGPVIGIQPEKPYIVVDSQPGELLLLHDWPAGLGTQFPNKPVPVRRLEYEYPLLGGADFKFFRKHSTGAKYRPMSWVPDGVGRTPIHPCGRLVDRGRTCYTTHMRFSRVDPGITVPVKWYFLEEGRATVPFEHPFHSRSWETTTDYPVFLGEVWERQHYSGRPPIGLDGIGLCGSRDAWENGAGPGESVKPINPTTGQPCCCGPGVLYITGGATTGPPPAPLEVQGGAAAGGLVAFPLPITAGNVDVTGGGKITSSTAGIAGVTVAGSAQVTSSAASIAGVDVAGGGQVQSSAASVAGVDVQARALLDVSSRGLVEVTGTSLIATSTATAAGVDVTARSVIRSSSATAGQVTVTGGGQVQSSAASVAGVDVQARALLDVSSTGLVEVTGSARVSSSISTAGGVTVTGGGLVASSTASVVRVRVRGRAFLDVFGRGRIDVTGRSRIRTSSATPAEVDVVVWSMITSSSATAGTVTVTGGGLVTSSAATPAGVTVTGSSRVTSSSATAGTVTVTGGGLVTSSAATPAAVDVTGSSKLSELGSAGVTVTAGSQVTSSAASIGTVDVSGDGGLGGGGVTVDCHGEPISETLTLIFTNAQGVYECLQGITEALEWDDNFEVWTSGLDVSDCSGGNLANPTFWCNDPDFFFSMDGDWSFQVNPDTVNSDPFSAVGSAEFDNGQDTGSVDWTIS